MIAAAFEPPKNGKTPLDPRDAAMGPEGYDMGRPLVCPVCGSDRRGGSVLRSLRTLLALASHGRLANAQSFAKLEGTTRPRE